MNFLDNLNLPADSIEKPPVLPRGTYTFKVNKAPTEAQISQGKFNAVTFPVVAVSADDDVDPDALAEFGNLSGGLAQVRFLFTTDPNDNAAFQRAMFQLKQFLLNSLRAGDGSDSLRTLMGKSVGCEFKAQVDHRVDGENVYIDLKNFHAAD